MEDGPGTVSFLDNHDMDCFLWVAGNNMARLKMAAIRGSSSNVIAIAATETYCPSPRRTLDGLAMTVGRER
jgi:hypothetical protein